MRAFSLALVSLLACIPRQCLALMGEDLIGFNGSIDGSVAITNANILCSDEEDRGIHIAVESLATDFKQITGRNRTVLKLDKSLEVSDNSRSPTAIVIGTLNSSLIQSLQANGSIDVSSLEGKWESFITTVVESPLLSIDRALVIAGSDKRGTIFGIYTIAEQCGQSPWHFFADVPAKHHDQIYALPKTILQGEPSVKYRGLFINDEEPALNGWWAKYNGRVRQPLDTRFYAHVFDLLLRLRANFLWPAMWASTTPPPGNIFFTDDPGNQQLADDYGIVISTTHHEPMQRATNEWNVTETGEWNWSENRDNITAFMDEGVARAGNNESHFVLGMRGLGDEAMDTEDAIEVLRDVFDTQRSIVEKYHGSPSAVPQVWALYKEVTPYYDAGLNPPDDVTLLFPDDNQGNMVRLPIRGEAERAGGVGVYYHLEYVGSPRAYKWANTNNLAKVYKELSHAHFRGADRIWVINVGDIKPMEVPFSLTMDMAWRMDDLSFERIPDYLECYAAREFGEEHALQVAEVLLEFSNLVGQRRYEHVTPDTYSVTNYHEAERVLERWETMAQKARSLYDQMSADVKPAFYQVVSWPVISGANFHAVLIGSAMNYQHARERRNSANALAKQVVDAFENAYDLVEEWDAMLDGKWAKIMSQPVYDSVPQEPKNWANPSRDMLTNLSYVQLRQNMQFSQGNLGIYAEESDSPIQQSRWAESIDWSMPTVQYPALLPQMDPYGPAVRRVEVFHRGDYRVPIDWTLDNIPVDWLTITPTAGQVSQDHSVDYLNVNVDWNSVPADFNETVEVGITATPAEYPYFDLIRIPVSNRRAPNDFEGYAESAGLISIESPHFQRSSSEDDGTVGFTHIPYLGSRSTSGSIALRPYDMAYNSKAAADAWVEYDIYLFEDAEEVNATLYFNTCLDTDPTFKMKYSLTLDGASPNMTRVLEDSASVESVGDVPPNWMGEVMNQVWTLEKPLGAVQAGKHMLRFNVNSPELYLEKLVLNTHEGLKPSYLGPPETRLVRNARKL